MLRTFWLCGRWAVTRSSPSAPTQTTVTCGLPSGLRVVRWHSGPVATRSRRAGSTTAAYTCRRDWMMRNREAT